MKTTSKKGKHLASFYPNSKEVLKPSESIVFDALHQLGDEYAVFPTYTFRRAGLPLGFNREIDFIIVDPDGKILCLEVKGGLISCKDGIWFTNKNQLKQSPWKQSETAMEALLRKLQRTQVSLHRSNIAYAVAFPDMPDSKAAFKEDLSGLILFDGSNDLSMVVEIPRIFHDTNTRATNQSVRKSIVNILKADSKPPRSLEERLRLQNSALEFIGRSDSVASDILKELEEKTRILTAQFENGLTTNSSPRIHVSGGPGTGKSVLAARLASQFAQNGRKVLLLSHRSISRAVLQRLLANNFIDDLFEDSELMANHNVDVHAPNSLMRQVKREVFEKGLEVPDRTPWSVAEYLFPQSTTRYDAIIIDEAQEFKPELIFLISSELAISPSVPIVIISDINQLSGGPGLNEEASIKWAKLKKDWFVPFDHEKLELSVNVRSTVPIVHFLNHLIPSMAVGLVDGPPVRILQRPASEYESTVRAEWIRLLSEYRFEPDQILIGFVGRPPYHRKKVPQKYFGREVHWRSRVQHPYPSNARARQVQGAEFDAVIVLDYGGANESDELRMRDFYILASRARTSLTVITERSLFDAHEKLIQNA